MASAHTTASATTVVASSMQMIQARERIRRKKWVVPSSVPRCRRC
jgi:hypothetical protein